MQKLIFGIILIPLLAIIVLVTSVSIRDRKAKGDGN